MSVIRQNQTSHLPLRDAADVYIALIKSVFGALSQKIATYRGRSLARAQLSQMSYKMLEDIGISRIDAAREAKKPFWKA